MIRVILHFSVGGLHQCRVRQESVDNSNNSIRGNTVRTSTPRRRQTDQMMENSVWKNVEIQPVATFAAAFTENNNLVAARRYSERRGY